MEFSLHWNSHFDVSVGFYFLIIYETKNNIFVLNLQIFYHENIRGGYILEVWKFGHSIYFLNLYINGFDNYF